ncbi:MAG: radical SAM protein [Patescibacteria group bacterium]|nr:radical SAM protein [Patescibacteria group bacterium]
MMKKIKTQDLKKLNIFLSGKCNLRCKHCFLGNSIYRRSSLSLKQVENVLRFFRKRDYSSVEFSGGEPTLSPILFQSISLARALKYEEIGISTNGTNPAVINQLDPKQVTRFTFSLDGATEKTNDFIRGQGHFTTCVKSIKKSVKSGFTTHVIFTANKINFHEFEKAARELDHIGVDRLSVNYTSFTGNAKKHPELILSPQEWLEINEKAKKIKGLKHIALRYPIRFSKEKARKQDILRKYPCLLQHPNRVYVFSNGAIYYCCLLTDEQNLNSGFVTEKGVVMKHSGNERSLLKTMPRALCPAQELSNRKVGPPSLPDGIKPICIYHRIVVFQGKSHPSN